MYIHQIGPYQDTIALSEANVAHIRARRLIKGDRLTMFDGQGLVARAVIVELSKRQVGCEIEEIETQQSEALPRLVVGVTKLSTVEFILQKATEIGVREIILLKTEYTPIAFDQKLFMKKKNRWEKIIVSACEQSETVFIPSLSWKTFTDYLAEDQKRYMFHLEGCIPGKLDKTADIMVGPEGGWSDTEVASGVELVTLNTGVLRTDTACIAALLYTKIS